LAVLITEAVDALKTPKTELHAEQGRIVSANNPDIHADFARLARRTKKKGIPLRWTGYFDPKTTPLDENGQGIPYATYAFAAHAAQVSVNILTGEVTVEKITAAHDVGRAIHPESVRGQIYGGVAMGVGFALMEEFVAGETKNLSDYLIPTSKDMPTVDAVIVECGESTGPFGAKGVGEPALIPTAPAVINALADALGTRIEALPATLERVLEAARSGQADPR
jgi:CO/xanthine dehydrogenase Mo-binding subunit